MENKESCKIISLIDNANLLYFVNLNVQVSNGKLLHFL